MCETGTVSLFPENVRAPERAGTADAATAGTGGNPIQAPKGNNRPGNTL